MLFERVNRGSLLAGLAAVLLTSNPAFFVAFADVEFLQSVLEIPTASTVGLGLLSMLLATAGFWLLRR